MLLLLLLLLLLGLKLPLELMLEKVGLLLGVLVLLFEALLFCTGMGLEFVVWCRVTMGGEEVLDAVFVLFGVEVDNELEGWDDIVCGFTETFDSRLERGSEDGNSFCWKLGKS